MPSRKHHLLKTFWRGWADVQSPDGTVVWTSPGGQTYTTKPGSMVLFPTLCRPTAPVPTAAVVARAADSARVAGLGMPRRERTRAQSRAIRVDELRRLNEPYVAERNKPPPF